MSKIFAGLKGRKPEEIFENIRTPAYILDEGQLRRNGEILKRVSQDTGCKILLAQKAFSNYDLYPVLAEYLSGTEASGLFEARLGKEEMSGKEVHVFCGAYREDEFDELLQYADHIVFNSPRQLAKFGKKAKDAGKSVGIRINPEKSTQEGHEIYDPCAPGSRLGTTRDEWDEKMTPELMELLDGIHFHTLCEQDSDALETTLQAVDEKFGDILSKDYIKWLNMGGGHHITRADYDIERLEACIRRAQEKWKVTVYLEPGEACALNAGYLAVRVLDIVENNGTRIAILDASAVCHMPDVIEMPYVPPLYGAFVGGEAGNKTEYGKDLDGEREKLEKNKGRTGYEEKRSSSAHSYRLGGPTCLAGDVIGDYVFGRELNEGDLLLFGDMAIYTTCKNNTFNGMPLPDILVMKSDGKIEKLAHFGYQDFKCRLGGE